MSPAFVRFIPLIVQNIVNAILKRIGLSLFCNNFENKATFCFFYLFYKIVKDTKFKKMTCIFAIFILF